MQLVCYAEKQQQLIVQHGGALQDEELAACRGSPVCQLLL